jgi:hypothetical protein
MISLNKRFPKSDPIWIYSNPKVAQQKAFEMLGPEAILIRSKAKNKKYCILSPSPDRKRINFGQMGYEDFTKHNDELRRYNYLNRTSKIKGNWKQNMYSPNNLSREILW